MILQIDRINMYIHLYTYGIPWVFLARETLSYRIIHLVGLCVVASWLVISLRHRVVSRGINRFAKEQKPRVLRSQWFSALNANTNA
jgi:hypothetical protein